MKFYIGDDPIPTVSKQPVKSLGRWYNASLRDKEQVQQLRQDITNGLENINKTPLPGKLKLLVFRALSNISLYGKGVLELPIKSLTEEYKCSKVRLQMTLTDS